MHFVSVAESKLALFLLLNANWSSLHHDAQLPTVEQKVIVEGLKIDLLSLCIK
jgi:hypothetical protein